MLRSETAGTSRVEATDGGIDGRAVGVAESVYAYTLRVGTAVEDAYRLGSRLAIFAAVLDTDGRTGEGLRVLRELELTFGSAMTVLNGRGGLELSFSSYGGYAYDLLVV